MLDNKKRKKYFIIGAVVIFFLSCLCFWIIQLAWNSLMPMFGLPELGFWQIIDLYFLVQVFFIWPLVILMNKGETK